MKRSTEIEAITRRFIAGGSDMEMMRRLYSDSADLIAVGTDDGWAHGPAEVLGVLEHEEGELETVDYDREEVFLDAFENGETGWSVGEFRVTLADGDAHTRRFTLVFHLDAGAWRIVHSHVSVPVPDMEIWGGEMSGTLTELLASINAESEARALEDIGLSVATIVFTDIVGSTVLSESMGDAAWAGLVTSHFETLGRIAEEQGGSLVKTLGDGAMLAFPTAASGLTAAIEVQRTVSSEVPDGLQVRIGVHTGDVMPGDDYLGLMVNKAARVAAAAAGGQILASTSTAGMVNPTQFDFGDPITIELKGLSGTHQVVPLVWTSQPN
jgi:class 3 adenylate cyclase